MNCLKGLESSLALKCLSKASFLRKQERLIHASVSRFEKDRRNHYEVLKIGKNSSTKEIRDAFLKLSKENHPDKNQSDPDNHEKFVRINEAYSVLSQPRSRSDYDRGLQMPHARSTPSGFHSSGSTQFYGGSPGPSEFYGGFRGQQSRPGYDPFRRVAEEYIFQESMRKAREAADREKGGDGKTYGQKKNKEVFLILITISIIAGWMQIWLVRYANGSIQDRFKEEENEYNTYLKELDLHARTHGNRYVLEQMVRQHEMNNKTVDLNGLTDENTKKQ